MLFVKKISNKSCRTAKLLYIMGASWHTKCMFDLDTIEDSFADILYQHGIETYAVDLIGSGATGPDDINHNTAYQDNLTYLKELVKEYDIDYVMGYSTGCAVAKDLALQINVKGVILLDPGANITITKELINNKFLIHKESVFQALISNNTNIKPKIAADYINALCAIDVFVTSAYPITGNYLKSFFDVDSLQEFFNKCNVKVFFTHNSIQKLRKTFPSTSVFYPDASHWILLEDGRYLLAQDIVQFVKSK